MAENNDLDEDIGSFIIRLKLPENYIKFFHDNGFKTTGDCREIDEPILKAMGITLPGHFRRILNKLPRCAVRKPPRNPKMDLLSPSKTDSDEDAGRKSPGLQFLPLASERTSQAHIEHGPVKQGAYFPSTELAEDPYLNWKGPQHSQEITTADNQLRPLTPPSLEFSNLPEDAAEESPYENTPTHAVKLPMELPDEQLFDDLPPPPDLPSPPPDSPPPPPPEDPYMMSQTLPLVEDENPYLTENPPQPSDDYNFLHETPKPINIFLEDVYNTTSQNYTDEGDYDHLKSDTEGSLSIPHSPTCIGGAVASIFAHETSSRTSSLERNQFEGEYDLLNSQSPRKEVPVPALLSPKERSLPRSNNSSESHYDHPPIHRTVSGDSEKSAKNLPLPPPPWKTVIEEKNNVSNSGGDCSMKAVLSKQNSVQSTTGDETDFWALDHMDDTNNKDEGDYDTLALNLSGNTNYGSKSMMPRTKSIQGENDDGTTYDYEVLEYKIRRPHSPQPPIGKLGELPPVPHNTPSHALDDYDDEEDQEASYEEVEFQPKDNRKFVPAAIETSIYGSMDSEDRGRSMTMNSQPPKDKKHASNRRFTGVQAQLQKAKAAVSKVKPKRKKALMKLGDSRNQSFSDNDSEGSEISSTRGSADTLNKSLEDLTAVSDLPPAYPSRHQRQPSDTLPPGASMPSSGAGFRGSRLTRISPVTRRKRVDALSYSSGQDFSNSQPEEGIYEDVDPRRNGLPDIGVRDRFNNLKENKKRPIKAPRQRPVSVFMDLSRNTQSSLAPAEDERSRTYSATLKRGQTFETNYEEEPDEYMDINEFLKQGAPILTVSPLTKKRTKSGWLWKHGGHEGRAPLRKRWAMFDGDELAYYESETKTDFSKGILPIEVMMRLQVPPNSQTIFHLQMKGGRTFIFQAENSDERTMWTSTLMAAMLTFQKAGHQLKPGGNMYMPYKEGALKMEGLRQKIYMAIKGEQAVYYKSKNEFIFAQPIARLQMKLATVKDIGNRKFSIVFPYRTFTFTADSEEEKKSWIEPLLDAIAEGLSDYQVLNEIWANETNKKCADCGRALPDWASINLAIVICKHCAGVHRELGVHNSKVRSLKMDIKIWEPAMKRLLIDIGNGEANRFWSQNLSSSDGITDMADKNQRSWFIKSKYIDMDYVKERRDDGDQEKLNNNLINAVRTDNLIEAYHVTFSGADMNCFTGKEHAKTPQLLAEHLTYTTLAEFLRQNGGTDTISPEGHITQRNTSVRKKNSIPKTRARPPVCLRDCLFKYGGDFKNSGEEPKTKGKLNLIKSALQPGDFQKRLCVLENNTLKYCDPEKTSVVKDFVSCNDLISITVHTPEQAVKAGYKHCFELSRSSGRTYLFCADREDTRIRWTRGLLQAIVPPYIQDAMQTEDEYERIGKVRIKAKLWSKADTQWSLTWCRLRKKKLEYFHNESRSLETIDLRKLVQITVDQTREVTSNPTNGIQNKDLNPVVMLVFRDKSYYIQSDTRPDSESWLAAIRRSDNESGARLEEKQLTTEGVPVVLEKCITYVEQFGIAMRGIYRLSGTHSKTTQLLSDFRLNARETQMREGQMNVHDVANALKRWFKSLPGSLLTEHLHDQWIETAQIQQEHHNRKLEWYKHLVEKLPDINRVTLKVLLMHLKTVSDHEKENEMSIHNLAIVFGPTLLEPQDEEGSGDKYLGQTSQEIACIEDLLNFYDWLFDVTDTDREKERRMQQAKEKINQATMQQNMLTTMDYDMMAPIYISRREDRCVNYKVNLTAGDLITKVCKAHGYPADKWGLYEVIMDGEGERPLHFSEHVLSVIKSWDIPSTNFLLAKNDYIRDKMRWFKQAASNDVKTIMEGQLRLYEGKKKWSKVTGCIARNLDDKTIYFKYSKNSPDTMNLDLRELANAHRRRRSIKTKSKLIGWIGNNSDAPSKPSVTMDISTFNVYVGVDKKTKPPGTPKQGFTIHRAGEPFKHFIAETEGELYRWISNMLISMHPEGFTPPVTQENSPAKSVEDTESRNSSITRSPYGSISQQDLGAQVAAKVASIRRTSSNESTGSFRERFLDHGSSSPANLTTSPQGANSPSPVILEDAPLETDSGVALEDVYDFPRSRDHSAGSMDLPHRPGSLGAADLHARRPGLHYPLSPADPRNQQRAGLGIQLQDELSNVLRKKRPQ
ncbi:uncharacterized protein LOC120340501 isoform X2 [Styela clava]